jgi:hypothetical protein
MEDAGRRVEQDLHTIKEVRSTMLSVERLLDGWSATMRNIMMSVSITLDIIVWMVARWVLHLEHP